MLYLHDRQIVHRDLKSLNIFLSRNGDVRIGDLGGATFLAPSAQGKEKVGTPFYFSPEVVEEKPYNHKSDIWSLGCVLYELCALKHPFLA